MHLSKQSRWIILLASTPVLCLAMFLAFWPVPDDPPPPRYLSVAFAGYTNDARGQFLPQYSLSNLTAVRIACVPIGVQVQVTSSFRTSTNVSWTWQPGFTTQSLQPGEVTFVTAVPPTNGVPWRFAVCAVKPTTRYEQAMDDLKPHLPNRVYRLLRGDTRHTQVILRSAEPAKYDETQQ